MAPQVTAALISGGVGLAQTGAGFLQNSINRGYQEKYNEQAQRNFEKQLDFNAKEAERARYFNSVPSLVNQYKAAGLNPNLLTGSIGGSSASAQAGSAPEFAGYYADNPASGLSSVASNYREFMAADNQKRLTDSAVALNDANAQKALAEANEIGFRGEDYYDSLIEKFRSESALFDSSKELNHKQIQYIHEKTGLTKEQIEVARQQGRYFSEMASLTHTKEEHERILKDTEQALRKAMTDYYRSSAYNQSQQGDLAKSNKRLIDKNYDILEQTAQSIITRANWDFTEHSVTVTDPVTGNQFKKELTPAELQFTQQLIHSMEMEYGIKLTNQRIKSLKQDSESYSVIAGAAAGGVVVNSVVDFMTLGMRSSARGSAGSAAPTRTVGNGGYYGSDGQFYPSMYPRF